MNHVLATDDMEDIATVTARAEQDYITRLRAALAALDADPLSIEAANAVRDLL
jgi:hypothetical protein